MTNNNDTIMLFEEWKDSNDYKMQEWFLEQKKQFIKWFSEPLLNGFEFDEFDWSPDDLYKMYMAELNFHDDDNQFTFTLIINSEDVIEGQVAKWKIECKAYDIVSGTDELLEKSVKDITIDVWSANEFVALVAEISDKAKSKTNEG